jgi:hypothetical protein
MTFRPPNLTKAFIETPKTPKTPTKLGSRQNIFHDSGSYDMTADSTMVESPLAID